MPRPVHAQRIRKSGSPFGTADDPGERHSLDGLGEVDVQPFHDDVNVAVAL